VDATRAYGNAAAGRVGASSVYDPVSNEIDLFSAAASWLPVNDVWVLTNANGLGGTSAWVAIDAGGGTIRRTLITPRSTIRLRTS